MTLIAIALTLIAERFVGRLPGWGGAFLVESYVGAWRKLLGNTPLWRHALVVPLMLVPPVWVVYAVFQSIDNLFVMLLGSAAVLLLCVSPRELASEIQQLLDARARGDRETAERLVRALQRVPEPDPSHRSLIGALFIQSHERLFGPLIWFFAFGPAGAVFYRLVSRLPWCLHSDGDCTALRLADALHNLAAWVPARFTALLYGLAGSLDDALRNWAALRLQADHGWRARTWAVLAESAIGAVEVDAPGGGPTVPASFSQAAQEVLSLQARALLIVLACFALFATGSWIA
jgi:membrane protein required for beta-lactamase induction